MPRIARAVALDIPHHVTQRGNYQQIVFLDNEDRDHYLAWIKEYSKKCGLKIWAYCLMDNHVHFIVVPSKEDSLARTFNQAHMRYSQYFNRRMKQKGHLWQGRFYSCALDEAHLYCAVRYVERNPVRVGLAKQAEDYPWSSALSHTSKANNSLLSDDLPLLKDITDWKEYLSSFEEEEALEYIRRCTLNGRPAGSEGFMNRIEGLLSRSLKQRPVGRPKKTE